MGGLLNPEALSKNKKKSSSTKKTSSTKTTASAPTTSGTWSTAQLEAAQRMADAGSSLASKFLASNTAAATKPSSTTSSSVTWSPAQLEAAQRMAASGSSLASSFLASNAPSYSVSVPSQIPNDVLDSDITQQDVLDTRNQMDAEATASSDFANYLTSQGSTTADADYLSRLMFPQTDPNLTAAREDYSSWLTKAGDYVMGMFGQDSVARRNELARKEGLAGAQEELAASNVRLAKLQGELQRIRPQIETEAGQTRIGAEARLNPVERNLRAEIASEALVQAALAGNVEMIQNNINTIMELEFADQERDLQIFSNRIKLEEQRIGLLEGVAKEQAQQNLAAAQIMLQDRADQLEIAQQEKKDVTDFAIAYLEATGDGAGAADIMRGDLNTAIRKYGSSLEKTGSGERPFVITSGALRVPASEIQEGTMALMSSRGDDGYVNTALYGELLSRWVGSGGLIEDFFDQYSPNLYLNPDDPTMPREVRRYLDQQNAGDVPKWVAPNN